MSQSNHDFTNTTALQIRLETQNLIDQIECFLRGMEPNTYWDDKSSTWQTRFKDMGCKRANNRGIHSLLSICRAIINPQVVQGNYTKDTYIDYIAEKRIQISEACFINKYEWELQSDYDIAEITNFIMDMVEPFFSRTIDNKERESYAQTIQTRETNTIPRQRKGINEMFQ